MTNKVIKKRDFIGLYFIKTDYLYERCVKEVNCFDGQQQCFYSMCLVFKFSLSTQQSKYNAPLYRKFKRVRLSINSYLAENEYKWFKIPEAEIFLKKYNFLQQMACLHYNNLFKAMTSQIVYFELDECQYLSYDVYSTIFLNKVLITSAWVIKIT